MNYFQRRRIKRTGRELLRQAKHVRNMREDLLREAELKGLGDAEQKLREALKAGNMAAVEREIDSLYSCVSRLTPRRSCPAFSENFEIIVVAVAVAMTFRAYFIQPFKIPTGSMQPTLYGIHSRTQAEPSFMDRMPMKLVKWLVYGEWYREVRVKDSGWLSERNDGVPSNPVVCYYYIGGRAYKIPRSLKEGELNFRPGQYVPAGAALWSGVVITGDHVFVDKLRWHFWKPRRGQVMVFSTSGIVGLPWNTHYIKRLVGLPGESVGIDPPFVLINGQPVLEPDSIGRIARQEDGYEPGYILPDPDGAFLHRPGHPKLLANDQYFVLGDNTKSSKDSRYWGSVPARNAVGPAFLIYWPFSERWGFAE